MLPKQSLPSKLFRCKLRMKVWISIVYLLVHVHLLVVCDISISYCELLSVSQDNIAEYYTIISEKLSLCVVYFIQEIGRHIISAVFGFRLSWCSVVDVVCVCLPLVGI